VTPSVLGSAQAIDSPGHFDPLVGIWARIRIPDCLRGPLFSCFQRVRHSKSSILRKAWSGRTWTTHLVVPNQRSRSHKRFIWRRLRDEKPYFPPPSCPQLVRSPKIWSLNPWLTAEPPILIKTCRSWC